MTIAYNSSLPANIRAEQYSLPKPEKILKLPPAILPKQVPLLEMQANAVLNVVSISKFSSEITIAEKI